MKKETIILSVLLVIIALVLVFSAGTNYSTYKMGYGEGYAKGYEAAVSDRPIYPQMTINGWEYTSDNSTVTIGGLTFTGEQDVLNAIAEMPEILKVQSDNGTFSISYMPSGETNITIISKGKTPDEVQ